MSEDQAKIAFLILSEDPARVIPGLVLASRLKENRGADVRVMFFGPGVKLAASGKIDEQINVLRNVGVLPKACKGNVEQYNVQTEMAERPIDLLAAGAEVQEYHHLGYTVLSF